MVILLTFPMGNVHALQTDVYSETLDCVIQPSVAVELSSSASGVLSHIYVERSQWVSRGEIVAQLESSAEQAALELIQAKVDSSLEIEFRGQSASLASRQLNRVNEARTREFLSHEEIDTRKTEARLSKIQLEQAEENKRFLNMELLEAKKTLERRSIRSPINGLVTEQLKYIGEFVDGDPVVKVVQLNPLYIQTIVSAEYMGDITPGMQASIQTSSGGDARYLATVDTVDQVVDIASGTFGVRLTLPNPEYSNTAGLRCTVQPEPMPEPMPEQASALPDFSRSELIDMAQLAARDSIEAARVAQRELQRVQLAALREQSTEVESQTLISTCDWPKVFDKEADAKLTVSQLSSSGTETELSQRKISRRIGYLVVSPLLEEEGDVETYLEQVRQTDLNDFFRIRNDKKPDRIVFGSFTNGEGARLLLENVLKQDLDANVIPWRVNRTQYVLTPLQSQSKNDEQCQ